MLKDESMSVLKMATQLKAVYMFSSILTKILKNIVHRNEKNNAKYHVEA